MPHRLRQVNQAAYEPELISIGPYHRNKQHLRDMEEIKWRFFLQIGKETRDRCFKACVSDSNVIARWLLHAAMVQQLTVKMFMAAGGHGMMVQLLWKEKAA